METQDSGRDSKQNVDTVLNSFLSKASSTQTPEAYELLLYESDEAFAWLLLQVKMITEPPRARRYLARLDHLTDEII